MKIKIDARRIRLVFCMAILSSVVMEAFANRLPLQPKAGKLRASVVKIDITPDVPKQLLGYGARVSTGINDRIYHRIIAIDDGVSQFFLVSSDICVISPSEYDHLASLVQKQLGVDPLNFWWSATHTHSAPEVGVPGLPEVFMGDRYKHPVDTAYTNFIEQSIIRGIKEAREKLTPAKMGIGWGYSQANINRRAIDPNGKSTLGLNPDGAVDRRIGIIRLEKESGGVIALIANYAIHGTVLGGENLLISGDVTGIVSEYVEEKIGAPVLFINGAAGNIGPIYSVYPNPRAGHLYHFKVLLGDKILEANKQITATLDSLQLFTGSIVVEGPRKENLSWPADLAKYSSVKGGRNMVRLPLRFLKMNSDIAIWSAPLELFCEISNEVRDRSPFPYTFYFGYTNGWLGYLPNEDAWQYGGYEVETVSPYTRTMGKQVVESVSGYLDGELLNKTASPAKSRKKR